MAGFQIALADPSFAADPDFVEAITGLINEAFAATERGIWLPGSERVSAARVTSYVAGGQIVAAWRGGHLAGVARVRLLSPGEAECSLVARAPDHGGRRLGSDLLAFAEKWARGLAAVRVRTELLTSRVLPQPYAEQMKAWLRSHRYDLVGIGDLAEWRPEMKPHLAAACDYLVFYKKL